MFDNNKILCFTSMFFSSFFSFYGSFSCLSDVAILIKCCSYFYWYLWFSKFSKHYNHYIQQAILKNTKTIMPHTLLGYQDNQNLNETMFFSNERFMSIYSQCIASCQYQQKDKQQLPFWFLMYLHFFAINDLNGKLMYFISVLNRFKALLIFLYHETFFECT